MLMLWSVQRQCWGKHPLSQVATPVRTNIKTCRGLEKIIVISLSVTELFDLYQSPSYSLCYIPSFSLKSSFVNKNNFPGIFALLKICAFCSSTKENDYVSHPYKTTGKITVFYILLSYVQPWQQFMKRTVYRPCIMSASCQEQRAGTSTSLPVAAAAEANLVDWIYHAFLRFL